MSFASLVTPARLPRSFMTPDCQMKARNRPAVFWLVPTIWVLLLIAKARDWSPPSVFSFLMV